MLQSKENVGTLLLPATKGCVHLSVRKAASLQFDGGASSETTAWSVERQGLKRWVKPHGDGEDLKDGLQMHFSWRLFHNRHHQIFIPAH